VFIGFRDEALREWLARPTVQERGAQLHHGFQCWQAQHPGTQLSPPDLRYLMLHSLAHLLITAVALEAGYHASSIRERVYVGSAGCGILLHTGTPDAEGTLGGLVQIGRHFSAGCVRTIRFAPSTPPTTATRSAFCSALLATAAC
jgi:hypothetical protein